MKICECYNDNTLPIYWIAAGMAMIVIITLIAENFVEF